MQVNDDKMLCLLQKYCISVKAQRCSYCCCFVAVASQVLSLALQMYGCRVMLKSATSCLLLLFHCCCFTGPVLGAADVRMPRHAEGS